LRRKFTARSVAELECLRPRWEELFRSAVADPRSQITLFQSFDLNLLAARSFSQIAPYVVLAETSYGATLIPAGIARDPDEAGAKSLTFLGEEMFDYRDYLAAGDDEAARPELIATTSQPSSSATLMCAWARDCANWSGPALAYAQPQEMTLAWCAGSTSKRRASLRVTPGIFSPIAGALTSWLRPARCPPPIANSSYSKPAPKLSPRW
jgi:hypothetical protein